MKKVLIVLVLLILPLLACESTNKSEVKSDTREKEESNVSTEVTSGVDLSTEYESLLDRIENVNIIADYVDKDTGETIRYNIYVPEGYDASQKYPLVLFLADASLSGSTNREYWRQGYGGVVWLSDSLQEGNPAIVIAPIFNAPVIDETTYAPVGNYIPALKGLIESMSEKYNIDRDRIYGTGQSMGGMALMSLSSSNPDLFTALMFVDCEYDREALKKLSKEKFFYFAAAGDTRAKTCMDEMIPLWESEGGKVTSITLNAQWPHEKIDAVVKEAIKENANIYCVTWEAGSVLTGENTDEREASFDFAYRVNAAVEWVLAQKK